MPVIKLGFDEADLRLAKLSGRLDDFSTVWTDMADDWIKSERKFFAAARTKWKTKNVHYARWKARAYPGAGPMVQSGRLMGSLANAPLGVEIIRPKQAELGTTIDYARYHPSWRLTWVGKGKRVLWERRVRQYVERAIAEVGL